METSPEDGGKLTISLSPDEQRALAAALARTIGIADIDTRPEDIPVIQTFAKQVSQSNPREGICFGHFCPEWAGPLSRSLGDYAIHAAAVADLAGPDAVNPEFGLYSEVGPAADALALEMAAVWGPGHTPSPS